MIATSIGVRAADNIRILALSMVEQANSGHPGGPMGGADFMHVLFTEFMNFDPDNPEYPFRDRFYLDPGHLSALLYAQLSFFGYYTTEDLQNFRSWKSPTPGHPEVDFSRAVENTSGPLGLGHAFGAGSAIAERFLAARFGEQIAHKTYIYISDGGVQEEISQGVGRTAGFLGLGNLIMFYDANNIQLSTKVDEVFSEDTAKKYEAWGWQVLTVEGNNQDAIREALIAANAETSKPTIIIGQTVMGKGAITASGESFEHQVDTHGKPLSGTKASVEHTIKNLGGNPEAPFAIFDEVAAFYQQVIEDKRQKIAAKNELIEAWRKANPEHSQTLNHFLADDQPLDFAKIEQKAGQATRSASGSVLAYLAEQKDNIIVASADLSNSDKTDAFLKKTTAFSYQNFEGKFFQAGVSELTMAALATGMALHGGVVPVCATFFAFSDYMKPAMRLAALMEQQVIFVWTHDSFRVGEDGPTHQPIEQEAQLRLLEKLHNHSGKPALMALRPADVHETTVAWAMALENRHSPTGLVLSRQNIENLPGSSFEKAQLVKNGGYTVVKAENPDVILVANGSEVATLAATLPILAQQGIKASLVSVPSEGVFRQQSKAYQQEVLPTGVKKFGLTAGLPVNLEGLVGAEGEVYGMTHFGYSANYEILDEKFGFTPAQVAQKVVNYLGE